MTTKESPVHQHVLKAIWARMDAQPEVEHSEFVHDLVEHLPPISIQELINRGIGTLLAPVLQNLRRKGYVRSVRHGVWKKEEAATFDEVSLNLTTRTRRGVKTVVNVAQELKDKIDDMPGLAADMADDLKAWIDLAEEEWFRSDHEGE